MARGHDGLCLRGLLVEVRTRAVALVEAVAADGPVASCLGLLNGDQPTEGFEPDLQSLLVRHPLPTENERLTNARVIIGNTRFEPWPVIRSACMPERHEPESEHLTHGGHLGAARHLTQILVDAQQREAP